MPSVPAAVPARLFADRHKLTAILPTHPQFRRLLFAGALALAGSLPAATAPSPRATGTPLLRVWTAEDYGAAPGNRAVLQHPASGYIYVANNTGLLEFDGARWRLLRVPGRPTVRALALDHRRRIWTANDDTICRLTPDVRGEFQAISMSSRLPAEVRNLRSAFAAVGTPEGVLVATATHLLRFGDDDGPARLWPLPEGGAVLRFWLVGDIAHWQTASRRCYRLRGDRIEPVDAVTDWIGGGTAAPLAPALTRLLSSLNPQGEEGAVDARLLADGRLAVATAREGLVVYDRTGGIAQRLNRANGLPSNRIEALAEDAEGGVWLALRNGLVRAQIDSPYVVHGPAQGFDGSLIHLGLAGDELYLAAGEGLMRRGSDGRFRFIDHLVGAPRRIVSVGNRRLVAGSNLQLARPDGSFRVLDERPHQGLTALRSEPGAFVFGAPNGLWGGRLDGERWQRLGPCANLRSPFFVLLEHPAGVIWGVSPPSGIWRIDFRSGLRVDAPTRRFLPADGVPAGLNEVNTRAFVLGDRVTLIVRGELFAHDPTGDRFGPETRLEGLPMPTGARAAPKGTPVPPAVAVACVGPDGTPWIQLPAPSRQTYRLVAAGPDRWRAEALPGPALPRFSPLEMLHDPVTRTLWMGGASGLVSYDLTWTPARPAPSLAARLRRIEAADGRLLWADGAGASAPSPLLELEHRQNALRLHFAAPSYAGDLRGRNQTFFRTQLEGLETTWTAWTRTAQRDFTNLPYRDFTLRVQARDDDGRASPEARFRFRIAPPWWLTGWAYAAYAGVSLLVLREAVRYRTRTLRRRAAELEAIITARTEELRVQNLELARLHQLELDEKISARLAAQQARLAQEKSDLELLRYQLNPHFLFNALTSVSGLVIAKPASARTMVAKLAEFCRGTLTRRNEETRTLAEEFAMLTNYLEIEKIRWEDGLQLDVQLAEELRDYRLPAFLLLPLVENAVKYGGQTSPEVLKVRLSAQRLDDGRIQVEVANTGRWIEPTGTPDATHIGLENLRERLAHAFPDRHELTTATPEGWVVVRLRIAPA
ncbi:MAG: histidine kinase [Verrucomicrobia bacterium]|nr:histidine kinase [Verrucomicrobiota bacterium]